MDRDADVARVRVAWREMRRLATAGALKHRFRDTSVGLLEIAQVDALTLLLQSEGLRMSELAEGLRVDASTATRAVQRLVDAGLAERQPDPCDRRGVVVTPTSLGLVIRAELQEKGRVAMNEVLAGFDDAELHQLGELLDRLVGAIEALAATEPD